VPFVLELASRAAAAGVRLLGSRGDPPELAAGGILASGPFSEELRQRERQGGDV